MIKIEYVFVSVSCIKKKCTKLMCNFVVVLGFNIYYELRELVEIDGGLR